MTLSNPATKTTFDAFNIEFIICPFTNVDNLSTLLTTLFRISSLPIRIVEALLIQLPSGRRTLVGCNVPCSQRVHSAIEAHRPGSAISQPSTSHPLITSPPFGCNTCPVMYEESSDARNT